MASEFSKKAWLLNQIISHLNDEDAYYTSGWLDTWPDGSDFFDCDSFFSDKGDYEMLRDEFNRVYKIYHEAGLYDADKETIDFAHEIDKELGLEPIQVLESEFDTYNTEKVAHDDDIMVYDFPQEFEKEMKNVPFYHLEFLGKVRDDTAPGYVDFAVKGQRKDLEKFAADYDYALHPDYLCPAEEYDLEDRLVEAISKKDLFKYDTTQLNDNAYGKLDTSFDELKKAIKDNRCKLVNSGDILFISGDEKDIKKAIKSVGLPTALVTKASKEEREGQGLEEKIEESVGFKNQEEQKKFIDDHKEEICKAFDLDKDSFSWDGSLSEIQLYDKNTEEDDSGMKLPKLVTIQELRGKLEEKKEPIKVSKPTVHRGGHDRGHNKLFDDNLKENLKFISREEAKKEFENGKEIYISNGGKDYLGYSKDEDTPTFDSVFDYYKDENGKPDYKHLTYALDESKKLKESKDIETEDHSDKKELLVPPYKIEYWESKEARDQGLGEYFEDFNQEDLEEAKDYAHDIFYGKYDIGDVQAVEVLNDNDEVVFGIYMPLEENLKEGLDKNFFKNIVNQYLLNCSEFIKLSEEEQNKAEKEILDELLKHEDIQQYINGTEANEYNDEEDLWQVDVDIINDALEEICEEHGFNCQVEESKKLKETLYQVQVDGKDAGTFEDEDEADKERQSISMNPEFKGKKVEVVEIEGKFDEDLDKIAQQIEEALDEAGIFYGDVVIYEDKKQINIVGVDRDEQEGAQMCLRDIFGGKLDITIPGDDYKEGEDDEIICTLKKNNESKKNESKDTDLINKLVAFGTCENEQEAKDRVSKMSDKDKEELKKSLEKQAKDHMLNDSLNEKKYNGKCPFCGSENIDFVDEDEDSEKRICRDCNKDFIIDLHTDEVTDRHNKPIKESQKKFPFKVWWNKNRSEEELKSLKLNDPKEKEDEIVYISADSKEEAEKKLDNDGDVFCYDEDKREVIESKEDEHRYCILHDTDLDLFELDTLVKIIEEAPIKDLKVEKVDNYSNNVYFTCTEEVFNKLYDTLDLTGDIEDYIVKEESNSEKLFKLLEVKPNVEYAIITADNPKHEVEDKEAQKDAKKEIEKGKPIEGKYNGKKEDSYLIFGGAFDSLRKDLGQEAIVTIKFDDEHNFIAKMKDDEGKEISTSEVEFPEKPEDNYSKVDDTYFVLKFNFDENLTEKKKKDILVHYKKNAGDPEKNMKIFNHMMGADHQSVANTSDVGSGDTSGASGMM